MTDIITMDHGSGFGRTAALIGDIFLKNFKNGPLKDQGDSALVETPENKTAFTTDSYVVNPIFFPGGDIGKLAVCGTVNDLAVSGAEPKYLSCGFILEEGLTFEELERVVRSMAETAEKAGVRIVTGDTKVVEKGSCDRIYINTAGMGIIKPEYEGIGRAEGVAGGDLIIINGPIAEHGLAVLSLRNSFENSIRSDCAPLAKMISSCLKTGAKIKFMRDATRGGIASVLSELGEKTQTGIELFEEDIPIKDEAAGLCEILGFDPLYVANEGKVLFVVAEEDADSVMEVLLSFDEGRESSVIGRITDKHPGTVVLNTAIGGRRIVDIPEGTQLPRIC